MPPAAEASHTLPWLQDVTRAAQYLTRLSLETAAQAAMIVHNSRLWSYAGELPRPAAEELAQVLVGIVAKGDGRDVARFVRLPLTGGDYLLYATGLADDMALALVFDVATPFSKIRLQAGKLAKALSSPPKNSSGEEYELHEEPANAWLPESEENEPSKVEPLPPLFENVPPPSIVEMVSPEPGEDSSLSIENEQEEKVTHEIISLTGGIDMEEEEGGRDVLQAGEHGYGQAA
jgi:hypothetical protein